MAFFLSSHYQLDIELFAVVRMPDKCLALFFILFLHSSHQSPREYIYSYNISMHILTCDD